MKFTVQPNALAAAYKAVRPVLSSKTAMPVLENILLQPVDDANVTLTASDGDNTVVVAMSVENAEDMRPLLMHSTFLGNYVGNVGQFPIDVEVTDGGEVVFTDFMGNFRFVGSFEVKEYPVRKKLGDDVREFDVNSADLLDRTMVAQKFTAAGDLRPAITGVCYDFQTDGLHVAASDSKILFTDVIGGITVAEPVQVIINPRMVNAVKTSFVSSVDAPIHIAFDSKSVRMTQGCVELAGRLIDARFPRYGSVIPKNNDKVVEVDRAQLAAAMKRVMIGINSATQQAVLEFDGEGQMLVFAEDMDFSVSATVKVQTRRQHLVPEGFKVGVRCNFFRELLDTMPKDVATVTILMSDPSRALLVLPDEKSKRISLIMPLLVGNG